MKRADTEMFSLQSKVSDLLCNGYPSLLRLLSAEDLKRFEAGELDTFSVLAMISSRALPEAGWTRDLDLLPAEGWREVEGAPAERHPMTLALVDIEKIGERDRISKKP